MIHFSYNTTTGSRTNNFQPEYRTIPYLKFLSHTGDFWITITRILRINIIRICMHACLEPHDRCTFCIRRIELNKKCQGEMRLVRGSLIKRPPGQLVLFVQLLLSSLFYWRKFCMLLNMYVTLNTHAIACFKLLGIVFGLFGNDKIFFVFSRLEAETKDR